MLLIGVDYHPSFQQIAFFEEETGECGEQAPGDASAQEHCQSSDGAQVGDPVVLDVAEWL